MPSSPANSFLFERLAPLRERDDAIPQPQNVCDICGAGIDGVPAGKGLLLWTRGAGDVRTEEPPLCEDCATAITAAAAIRFMNEAEEG